MHCAQVMVKSGVVGNMERDENREIGLAHTEMFFFFFLNF